MLSYLKFLALTSQHDCVEAQVAYLRYLINSK